MFTSIEGRKLIVTGASKVIGKGIANVFASQDESDAGGVERGVELMAPC